MHLQLEAKDKFGIQAYSESEIKIDGKIYHNSLIIGHEILMTNWQITDIAHLNEQSLQPIKDLLPEIIIIGHTNLGHFPPFELLAQLSKERLALEYMNIGAACRTYNVLLSEQRQVILGIILPQS